MISECLKNFLTISEVLLYNILENYKYYFFFMFMQNLFIFLNSFSISLFKNIPSHWLIFFFFYARIVF